MSSLKKRTIEDRQKQAFLFSCCAFITLWMASWNWALWYSAFIILKSVSDWHLHPPWLSVLSLSALQIALPPHPLFVSLSTTASGAPRPARCACAPGGAWPAAPGPAPPWAALRTGASSPRLESAAPSVATMEVRGVFNRVPASPGMFYKAQYHTWSSVKQPNSWEMNPGSPDKCCDACVSVGEM